MTLTFLIIIYSFWSIIYLIMTFIDFFISIFYIYRVLYFYFFKIDKSKNINTEKIKLNEKFTLKIIFVSFIGVCISIVTTLSNNDL